MSIKHLGFKVAAAALLLLSASSSSYAVDSASAEFATGNKTQMARFAAQWDWQNKWWQSNGTHIGGYWDLSIAEWHGNRYNNTDNQSQDLVDIGLTPVFRFQRDDKKGFYGEAGIGVHLMSQVYNNNDRHFSTAFQFGDHVGTGYVFANGLDLGIRLQHFSNGGIKQPNGGVNFAVVRAAYHF
ncbi:acyloxyacyl hydrolase [Herbaspirillum sp. RTI4]|uniref:acyloxyacyl hydrolase n=1 Tax=Herbaspirillum sp. RTI4 TaxID=3048640 RepID=UPI002AB54F5F|nr:acyloxyacyl hydrolase [Herbaspirillum sp. RTI4]MDY7577877.1 acyloxyacyl hydrolase [Herbaspirillum sp. RTI4]MEA9981677.1 acyloxyacyl hydrolase [Herbaspirillum sp. RTI4]